MTKSSVVATLKFVNTVAELFTDEFVARCFAIANASTLPRNTVLVLLVSCLPTAV